MGERPLQAESVTLDLLRDWTEESYRSAAQNRELAARVARALRPGGVYAILDAFRAADPDGAGQIPALLEFYFALSSQSGTWPPEEMAGWQRDAGLRPRRPIRFRRTAGLGSQAATKPG